MLKSKHFLLFLPLLTEVKCCPVLESTWGVPGRVYREPSQWFFFCSPSNYHTLLFEPIQLFKVKKTWLRDRAEIKAGVVHLWRLVPEADLPTLKALAWSRHLLFEQTRVWLKSSNNRNSVIYTHPVWHQQQIYIYYWYNVESVQLLKNSKAPSGDSSADFFNLISEHSFHLNLGWIEFVSVPHVSTHQAFLSFLLVRRNFSDQQSVCLRP